MPEISKRKLESYKRAEAAAQAARLHLLGKETSCGLFEHVFHWLKVAGKTAYETPAKPPKRRE